MGFLYFKRRCIHPNIPLALLLVPFWARVRLTRMSTFDSTPAGDRLEA